MFDSFSVSDASEESEEWNNGVNSFSFSGPPDEKSFLRRLVLRTIMFGLVGFPFAPMFFFLGRFTSSSIVLLSYGAHLGIGVVGQILLLRMLEKWVVCCENAETHERTWKQYYHDLLQKMHGDACSCCGKKNCMPRWFSYTLMYSPAFIRNDMNFAVAGVAWSTWDPYVAARYEKTLGSQFFLGHTIHGKSPTILTTLAIITTVWQTLDFCRRAWGLWNYRLPYWPESDPNGVVSIQGRFRFWQWYTHLADTICMTLVGKVAYRCQQAEASMLENRPAKEREAAISFPSHSMWRGIECRLSFARKNSAELPTPTATSLVSPTTPPTAPGLLSPTTPSFPSSRRAAIPSFSSVREESPAVGSAPNWGCDMSGPSSGGHLEMVPSANSKGNDMSTPSLLTLPAAGGSQGNMTTLSLMGRTDSMTGRTESMNQGQRKGMLNPMLSFAITRPSMRPVQRLPYVFPNRSAKFAVFVAGATTPQLWFQVSQLGVSYNVLWNRQRMLMLLSIGWSVITVFRTLPNAVRVISQHWQRGRLLNATKKLAIVVLVVLATSISIVRLVGVWWCPSHILDLTMSCVDFF